MKEFFLGRFFSGDKLNVIDEQHVIPAIFLPERRGGVGADSVDHLVGKGFRRDVEGAQSILLLGQVGAPEGYNLVGLLVIAFLGIAGFFLVTEHTAHVFGILPYVLLLLCPLLHLFMHRGHSEHADHTVHQEQRLEEEKHEH